jgi:hypothetical protein
MDNPASEHGFFVLRSCTGIRHVHVGDVLRSLLPYFGDNAGYGEPHHTKFKDRHRLQKLPQEEQSKAVDALVISLSGAAALRTGLNCQIWLGLPHI